MARPGCTSSAKRVVARRRVQRALELRPDVIVMDVNMPGMSGIEATRAILEGAPDSAVLMLTVSESDDEVLDAVLAGASGYLLKDAKLADHRRDPRRSRR